MERAIFVSEMLFDKMAYRHITPVILAITWVSDNAQ